MDGLYLSEHFRGMCRCFVAAFGVRMLLARSHFQTNSINEHHSFFKYSNRWCFGISWVFLIAWLEARKMPRRARQPFELRPHDPEGMWESNDGRYRSYAHQLLAEHKSLCKQVLKRWPKDAGASIADSRNYPELMTLARKRDQTSDTTRIYAAMAVEGYLNFYGVLRLGQSVFDEHFERPGLVPKLRALLLVCDQLDVPGSDEMVQELDRVAQSRNALVHPKTREVRGDPVAHQRTATPMPETAEAAVRSMEAFFDAFIHAVPKAENHLNRLADA